jgi:hypothetical protein
MADLDDIFLTSQGFSKTSEYGVWEKSVSETVTVKIFRRLQLSGGYKAFVIHEEDGSRVCVEGANSPQDALRRLRDKLLTMTQACNV